MAISLLCRKIGMTQIFVEGGECIPVTVLQSPGNPVVQKKTVETDGYSAVQLGFGERPLRTASKPLAGHYQKANLAPKRHLRESRLTSEEVEGYEVGQIVRVDIFETGQRVDVTGTSKGRGTAGVVKRHGFTVKSRTHGTHENTRHTGSIGAGSYPGRVIKGLRMAGRLGDEQVTTPNLEVVRVDADQGLLFVRGAVPGHRNGLVRVCRTVKASG